MIPIIKFLTYTVVVIIMCSIIILFGLLPSFVFAYYGMYDYDLIGRLIGCGFAFLLFKLTIKVLNSTIDFIEEKW